jgi:cadmium resistance protein CadD (predicted permease)
MKKRLGNFLLTVGVVLLFLFFISDYVEQVEGWYLLLGVIFFGLGISLAWQGRTPPEPTRRFRLLRRMMGKEVAEEKDVGDSEENV